MQTRNQYQIWSRTPNGRASKIRRTKKYNKTAKKKACDKRYNQAHPEKHRLNDARYRKNLRVLILNILGNKCARCGFLDTRALQIDHINGGGRKHRATFPSRHAYYRYVRDNPANFQCLCSNCNWIKRAENKEYYISTGLKHEKFFKAQTEPKPESVQHEPALQPAPLVVAPEPLGPTLDPLGPNDRGPSP